jgi:uncharacterized protein (TIGR00730 family)
MMSLAMIRSVCVFCGSSIGRDHGFAAVARELGGLLARRGLRLICGGGGTGLMGELARSTLAAGGEVTGVMPRFMVDREAAMSDLADLRIVATMHERKAQMTKLADAFIALPGGLGTLEELFEVWSHAQIGLHKKPVCLLNTDGYFDDLIRFCDRSVAAGFTKPERRELLLVAAKPAELIERLAG